VEKLTGKKATWANAQMERQPGNNTTYWKMVSQWRRPSVVPTTYEEAREAFIQNRFIGGSTKPGMWPRKNGW